MMYCYNILTSSFHDLLLISNIQISGVPSPPTTSRCGPELVLINTLELPALSKGHCIDPPRLDNFEQF